MSEQQPDLEILRELRALKKIVLDNPTRGEAISLENKANIEKILYILNGNGDPKHGMLYKLDRVYDWMPQHIAEHKSEKLAREQREQAALEKQEARDEKERERLEEAEKDRKDKYWDILSVIIRWLMPALLYALATFIAESTHLF